MRIVTGLLAATAGLVVLAAGPAHAAVRDFPARGFDKVELSGAADVTILTGRNFSVHADGDQAMLDRMTADVRGGTLVVGWRSGGWFQNRDRHVHVTITMPRISGVARSGAGDMTVDRVQAPDFTANISGAGSVRLPAVRSGHVSLTLSGAGDIEIAGIAGQVDGTISGVGTLDATRLIASAGRFKLSGTGNVRATVNGPADVSLSGIGEAVIGGRPQCTVHKSGLGSVRCG